MPNYCTLLKGITLIAAPLLLTACGGSSGGPGGPGGTSFVGFPLPDNSTTKLTGIAKKVHVEDENGAISVSAITSRNVTATVGVDADGDLSSVAIDDGQSKQSWDASNSTSGERSGYLGAVSNDGNRSVLVASPETAGLAYQTYGLWAAGDKSATSGDIEVFSVGSQTASASIPTQGTATFTGTAGGVYASEIGEESDIVTASAKLGADFANKSVTFNTTGTTSGLTGGSRSDLDLSGSLSYAGGAMTGNVTSAGGMSGTADGQFYGPGAEEIGGVFAVKGAGPGGETLFGGGFGAKR